MKKCILNRFIVVPSWASMKCRASEKPDSFSLRASRFFEDPLADVLTGPRRMPLSEFMALVRAEAEAGCYRISDADGADRNTQVIFFDTWVGNSDSMCEAHRRFPKAAIIYGQDLCHQVPAAVRYRPRQ